MSNARLQGASPNRKRGWYQFSLRTLCTAVVLVSAIASMASMFGAVVILVMLLSMCAGGFLVMGWGIWHGQKLACIVGVGLIALASMLFGNLQGARWIGSRALSVTVHVLDRDTGAGVSGASVCLDPLYANGPSFSSTTGIDGSTIVRATFTTVGSDDLFKRSGAIYLWGHSLAVSAPGYEPTADPVASYTGETWDLYGKPLPPITIRLKRLSGSANSARPQSPASMPERLRCGADRGGVVD
jgi:hypothetical protein